MLISLCPCCGRPGLIKTPRKGAEVECPYCGEKDLDWITRPDMDCPVSDKAETAVLKDIERLGFKVLRLAYDIYDSVRLKDPPKKLAKMEEIRSALQAVVK